MADRTTACRLDGLPTEVLLSITRYLQTYEDPPEHSLLSMGALPFLMSEPTDLLNLCLVSKRLYQAATVALHEQVACIKESPEKTSQRGTWTSKHQADQHQAWHDRLRACMCLPGAPARFANTKILALLDRRDPADEGMLEAFAQTPNITTLVLWIQNPSIVSLRTLRDAVSSAPLHRLRTFAFTGNVLVVDAGRDEPEEAGQCFLDIVTAFPSLLDLYWYTSDWGYTMPSRLPSAKPKIKNLSLIDGGGWILPLLDCGAVETLLYEDDILQTPQVVLRLAQNIATKGFDRLHTLHLDLRNFFPPSFSGFSSLVSLRRLHLQGYCHAGDADLFHNLPYGIEHIVWLGIPSTGYQLLADLLTPHDRGLKSLSSIEVDTVGGFGWGFQLENGSRRWIPTPEQRSRFLRSVTDLEVRCRSAGIKLSPSDLYSRHLRMEDESKAVLVRLGSQ